MGKPLTVAVTGFAGLEDPGPGTSVAHALRQGWRGALAIHAWVYGGQVNGAWLPGVIDRVEVLPPVHAGDQRLYEAILEIHRKAPVDALLPGDADVPIIARLADRLADRGIRTLLPPAHRVEALARANLGRTLHERQIAGPLTINVASAHEVAPLADRIGYPLFVRGVNFGERLVYSAQQAHAEAERLNGSSQPGVTLQYRIAGDRYSIGLVADRDGQCRAIVTMKIIAVNGEGRTVTGTIVDVEHIERFARDCLQAFEWRGPLTLEAVQPVGYGHALVCDVKRHLPSWCQASHWGGTNLAVVLLEEIFRRRRKVARPRAGTMFVRGILELPVAVEDLVRLKQHGHLDRFERPRPVRIGPRAPRDRKRLTVAVTGTSTFDVINPGLGVARALRVAPEVERIYGLAYGTLESGAYQPALFDEVFRLPDGGSFDALAYRIEEIHRAHPFDVLVPCLDGELPLFIRMKPRLDALGIGYLLPDQKAFDRRAKANLFSGRLRAQWGEFSIPESRFARSEAETVRAVECVGLPAVVKGPLFMSLPVQSLGEAQSAWHQLAGLGWTEVIVQRKISGPYYATSVVCDREHEVLSALTIKKLAICQRGSTWSAVRVSEPQLEADFAKFLRAIKWTGPGEGEFVRDEMTDRFFLFEVNPRFTGWIFYSAALGCNQPAAAVHAALGEAVAPAGSAGDVAFMRQTTEFPLRPSHLAALATRGHLRHA
jgi:carbamoyl-phosphate synthase large subunit